MFYLLFSFLRIVQFKKKIKNKKLLREVRNEKEFDNQFPENNQDTFLFIMFFLFV